MNDRYDRPSREEVAAALGLTSVPPAAPAHDRYLVAVVVLRDDERSLRRLRPYVRRIRAIACEASEAAAERRLDMTVDRAYA